MLKPKIKKINWFLRIFLRENITGITLAPIGIYLREDIYEKNDERTINHEHIHWQQQLELFIIPFYILYFIFNIIYGYRDIPFERESYTNDINQEYLKNRKRHSWIKYFR